MCTGYSSNETNNLYIDELEMVLSVIDVNLQLSIRRRNARRVILSAGNIALLVPSDICIDQYYTCFTLPGNCVK